ncbi:MAG: hypothetical protein HKN93_08540 [Acidimicrobiia bacterium]|nr:hypothetical protein [Acidimicrobiia bacterium]
MQRQVLLVVSWMAVTGLSVFVATQAVGAVRDNVTTAPAPLTTVAPVVDTTTTASTTTTTLPATTEGSTTTSTTAAGSASTTTTSTSTVPATTTSVSPQIATYQLTGGWVRVQYGTDFVQLVDAAPYAGFSMKIEMTGPPRVEVEFEADGYEAKFKAAIESGQLEVSIEDDNDDD